MKRAILMYTVGRSGHHAVINWIQKQFPGVSRHHNHAYREWDQKKMVPMHRDKGITTVENEGEDELDIYSIEDLLPEWWSAHDMRNFPCLTEVDRLDILWHVRDPFNWLASSILKNGQGAKPHIIMKNEMGYIGTRIEVLRRQVADAGGVRTLPKTNHIDMSEVETVNYTKWFQDKSYREDLANTLDIPFTDAGINEVPSFGGGSTFDEKKFDSNAQQMQVLERWKAAVQDPRFYYSLGQCFDWVFEFSREYFDFVPPIENHLGPIVFPWDQ